MRAYACGHVSAGLCSCLGTIAPTQSTHARPQTKYVHIHARTHVSPKGTTPARVLHAHARAQTISASLHTHHTFAAVGGRAHSPLQQRPRRPVHVRVGEHDGLKVVGHVLGVHLRIGSKEWVGMRGLLGRNLHWRA